jgi:hypothetical protein
MSINGATFTFTPRDNFIWVFLSSVNLAFMVNTLLALFDGFATGVAGQDIEESERSDTRVNRRGHTSRTPGARSCGDLSSPVW